MTRIGNKFQSLFFVRYVPIIRKHAAYYAEHNADVKAICGINEAILFQHFITSGMMEGRQASEEFNVQAYKARYSDLHK